ncbi:hypothetical protein ACHAXR_008118 [Thalassiosira sp. AJA248-18]
METLRVMYFIVISLTNAHSVPVTSGFGFSPTCFSVGFHVQTHSPKLFAYNGSSLRMVEDFGSNNDDRCNGVVGGNVRRTGERKLGIRKMRDSNNRKQRNSTKKRDISSPANARVKMKKLNSSSCSKLLTPPSILSSSRHASDRRRWARNLSGQHHRVDRKRMPPQNSADRRSTKFTSSKVENAPKMGSKGGSSRNGLKREKNKTDSQITDKTLSIPPFTFASDGGGVSLSPNSIPSDPLEPRMDHLTQSSKGSLLNNQLESPHLSSSEPPLIGCTDISLPAIEGVLPVSELFYRSTQTMFSSSLHGDILPSNALMESTMENENDIQLRDDEELPFSAEQSGQLSTPGNKIQIRRHQAPGSSLLLSDFVTGIGVGVDGDRFPSEVVQRELTTMAEQEQEEQRRLDLHMQLQPRVATNLEVGHDYSTMEKIDSGSKKVSKGTKSRYKKSRSRPKADRGTGRKMVRRGMEMLVGGEPINADPPQRSIELNYYRKHPKLWARAITTNSPDFGPLLHMHSAGKVEKKSLGLFCENFVDMTLKWGICSDDLKFVVSEHEERRQNSEAASVVPSVSKEDMVALIQTITSSCVPGLDVDIKKGTANDCADQTIIFSSRELDAPKGFGAQKLNRKKRKGSRGGRSGITSDKLLGPVHTVNGGGYIESDTPEKEDGRIYDNRLTFTLGGELKFSLGVSRFELEYGNGRAFRRVLRDGIGLSINSDVMGFDVHIAKLVIVDVEGGSTDVIVQFQLRPWKAMGMGEAEQAAKEVNGALANAMDDGKMAMTLAHVAREEKGWSVEIRNRIVEEFLFETEDDDEKKDFDTDDASVGSGLESNILIDDKYDGPFGMEGDVIYAKDDIWLGGGNGGVFFDYSESNHLNSPYKGKLGPYLVDSVTERARQNQSRVIAIGDVHGCIDELKALLKKCDYHPGDTIVFLGDLVCKGPDSLSVVQLAREVGAIGVRGNHDFEVVRWHQAIKSGADPPVIGSEHYYVASALNTADLKWMYSLPWYISSSHLNALFVHAGFVSGIRLAKQNPRLMMNMRSILPDGTVTSKFFNNWPWARLWDGPQTVFFGHDADRGLQQYEHAIGLDTGCVYGGKLTACILPERRLVSVNAKREYFQYRRKHFD